MITWMAVAVALVINIGRYAERKTKEGQRRRCETQWTILEMSYLTPELFACGLWMEYLFQS